VEAELAIQCADAKIRRTFSGHDVVVASRRECRRTRIIARPGDSEPESGFYVAEQGEQLLVPFGTGDSEPWGN
jgi:hypothetical protein